MSKQLTKEQIQARIVMYNEAADHMDATVHDSKIELEQAMVVQKQIRKMCKKFSDKYEKPNA